MCSAANLYSSVINDVVNSVRDSFMDESVDESVLQELKTLWINKLDASKTVEPLNPRTNDQPSQNVSRAAAAPPTAASQGVLASSGRTQTVPSAAAANVSAASNQQIVITDPNKLVPVQITIPAQPGNPASQPRALTIQVPAHALQQSHSNSSALLHQVLTQAITQALTLPESHAAVYLQSQINSAFRL